MHSTTLVTRADDVMSRVSDACYPPDVAYVASL
jgi:hypothetical protein